MAPSYRNDPLYWQGLWPNLLALAKSNSPTFKLRFRDAIFTAFLLILEVWIFKLGSQEAWQKRPAPITISLLFLVLASSVFKFIWWLVGILWKLSKRPRFTGYFRLASSTMLASTLWALGYWHYSFVRGSHFEVTIECPCATTHITDFPGVETTFPVASVYFHKIRLANKYAPATPTD